MLDHVLSTYLHVDSPRVILPKTTQALRTLSTYVDQILDRHKAVAGAETSGMRILEQIFGDTDMAALRHLEDDFDRYLDILLPLQEDLVRHLDPTQEILRLGEFATTAKTGREYLLPITCTDYISQLPMNQDWSAWAALRPLRLLYGDSPDLSLNAYLDKLRYSKHPPFHVVFGLDAIMLVMQYAKYLDTHPPDQRVPIPDYLHTYVLYPALIHDSVTTWLLHQYSHIFHAVTDGLDRPTFGPLNTPMMGSFGSQFPSALDEIWHLANDAKEQSVSPVRCLASLLLEHTYLPHAYHRLRRHSEIPPLRQYTWIQYLATFGWRNLIFATMALTKTHPLTKATSQWVKRDFHLLNATRFWNTIPDAATKRYIETDFQEKIALLDTL